MLREMVPIGYGGRVLRCSGREGFVFVTPARAVSIWPPFLIVPLFV